jgi:hypothetical protein
MYDAGSIMNFLNAIPLIGKTADNTKLWVNFGLSEKPPIFDVVFYDEWEGVGPLVATDPVNEGFTSLEFGANFNSDDNTMAGKLNFYYTKWADRNTAVNFQSPDGNFGDDTRLFLTGVNQLHTGIEAELAAQLNDMFRVDIGVSIGNWRYTEDAKGTFTAAGNVYNYNYALKDLKVGDQPQASFYTNLGITPIEGATVELLYKYYAAHYAYWPSLYALLEGDQ